MAINVLAWCPYCHNRRIVQRADGRFIRCWPCRRQCGHIHLGLTGRWTKKRHEEIKREAQELYDRCQTTTTE